MTMSPFLITFPTVSLAFTSGVRSGRLFLSTGVGTVMMYTLAFSISFRSAEQKSPLVPALKGFSLTKADFRSSSDTSKVSSCPAFSSVILFWLMSKPTTGNLVANNLANGSPT